MKTMIGREVKQMIDWYLSKNVFTSPQVIKKTDINYELFFKIIGGKSCIKEEIRRKFLGYPEPLGHLEPDSIVKVFTEEQNEYFNEGLDERLNLFDKMDYYDDTCLG